MPSSSTTSPSHPEERPRRGSSLKRALFALLPERVTRRLQDIRRIAPSARLPYVNAMFSRLVGMRRDRLPERIAPDAHIVFVCHGNIIRSPMAEMLMRERLEQRGSRLTVSSAGLHARAGRSADARALRQSRAFGVSLDAHVAQPLTTQLVDAASVIFVMDYKNEAELLSHFPGSRSKVVLLGAFAPDGSGSGPSIPDPYEGDAVDVERCYRRLVRAVDEAADQLSTTK